MNTKDEFAHYPQLAQTLLRNRGITTKDDADRFLNPSYERDVNDPFLMQGMERAVLRILKAMETQEKIVIFGDYDCDGIPGSVILHDFFKKIGYDNVHVYIPHRHNEGYGMNIPAIETLAEQGSQLLITVDCGITEVQEVARAHELGMEVIITDHHLPGETLPSAYVIVNPKQQGDTYPDVMLCGAGVAWKLVCALLVHGREKWSVSEGYEKWLLDMAGLATIADMVPLQNENRALAYFGLKVLRLSRRIGLKKILEKTGTIQTSLTEDDIGFTIGPRINAASRMGIPMDAFRLLATTDEKEAEGLAEHLVHLNETRKGLVASMVKEARKHLEARIVDGALREVIVIGNPSWMPGLAGLVAGTLAEAYARPVFVWGRAEDGVIKGSCRSDGACDVVELMTNVRVGMFLDIGGHARAGGFSLEHDGVHHLENELVRVYQSKIEIKKIETQMIDATLTLSDVTMTTWSIIERFAPFGVGNPKPTFLFETVRIAEVKKFGKERTHLELRFENSRVKAISFFAEEKYLKISSGDTINLVAVMELNTFRGARELRLRIVNVVN
ncbi:MAG: single-stranded-DNA-specific exonuclease RecJ [Candidatus Yonathbacteria bacterium RIFCSPLOWO2_01_FULL_43_27]|uniref:Single-stranded-DNA-specific exonuclease RecJ n=2 Tax=Parcubacteria group TaxID=1794811 RepID=A0A1G2SDV4_9BACT|nr:MAG: Single-stranded-DNA-specific exonuclease recJ [Candidatus Azambacteria bacterium GW2011_GWA1_44_9]OHA78721.1 MAG: single-stranded-DNA-specific exonuclease RecJ [Candidatus Yonathbacteria bacterium RIFCSPHIGHO2_01_FULL_44_19]OHA83180.1 MAG: single-stranded-DNA-specific exonuclease RecJ [Candidatus Yonathbacteria bacterium RIFCSPLOWO2_01_FULL_43_27]